MSTINEKKEHQCEECLEHFRDRNSLKIHFNSTHILKNELKCEKCGYTTNYRENMLKHLKTHVNLRRSSKVYLCPLCNDFKSQIRKEMKYHYANVHDITLQYDNYEFKSNDDFMAWKAEKEKEEVCKFISPSGSKKRNTTFYQEFRCFRDGLYSHKGDNIRHLKIEGSNKIGGVCPASMSTRRDANTGVVSVKFCKTHVGHHAELGRISLTEQEKSEIALKIAAKIPFDTILDGIRDSITDDNIGRLQLINRKDLWNIEQSYSLGVGAGRRSNHCTTVESWIWQMIEESSIIRFYKELGSVSPLYPDLEEDDFVLIIANDAQLDMLKNHGSDCICFESTHGVDQYGFELTTLLVLDGLKQGFPTAFLISSRTDTQIISLFASVLKQSLESPIHSSVLMSDMADIFYNGWCSVMPKPTNWLFSMWHVDRVWRENLNKITCVGKRPLVYKMLRTLLEEKDENVFPLLLANFIKALKNDPETTGFGQYFEDECSPKYSSWAFSNRKYCGINTNMNFENMHKVLKHIYLKENKAKRLDKAINALMRFTRDKLYDLIVLKTKGKLTSKILDTRQRHKKSLQMKDSLILISEEGWSLSQPDHEPYNIIKLDAPACDCTFKCEECNICIHSFRCSCIDSTIKWNICKHIHKICSFLQENEASQLAATTNADECFSICLEDGTLPTIVQQSNEKQFDKHEARKLILDEFMLALNEADSPDDFDIIRKAVRTIRPAMSVSHSKNLLQDSSQITVDPMANVSPQPSLFCNGKTKSDRLSRPTKLEKIVLSNLLVMDQDV